MCVCAGACVSVGHKWNHPERDDFDWNVAATKQTRFASDFVWVCEIDVYFCDEPFWILSIVYHFASVNIISHYQVFAYFATLYAFGKPFNEFIHNKFQLVAWLATWRDTMWFDAKRQMIMCCWLLLLSFSLRILRFRLFRAQFAHQKRISKRRRARNFLNENIIICIFSIFMKHEIYAWRRKKTLKSNLLNFLMINHSTQQINLDFNL